MTPPQKAQITYFQIAVTISVPNGSSYLFITAAVQLKHHYLQPGR